MCLSSRRAPSSCERPTKVALGLDVRLDELQMQGAQEARRLAQDRDDPRVRADVGDQPCGRPATRDMWSMPRRRAAVARPPANSDRYCSSVSGIANGLRGGGRKRSSGEKYQGSFSSHMNICGWRLEHLVQGRGPALGVPDDEEVRDSSIAVSPRAWLAPRRLAPVAIGRTLIPTHRRAPVAIAERRPIVGVVTSEKVDRVECDQAAVDDHHHAIADVERRHTVRDDEQRQFMLERTAVTPGSWPPSSGRVRSSARRARSPPVCRRGRERDTGAAADRPRPRRHEARRPCRSPSPRPTISSWMCASFAACSTALSSSSRSNRMLSATVACSSRGSCGT